MPRLADSLPKAIFTLALLVLVFAYGYLAHRRGWFPHAMIVQAEVGWHSLRAQVGVDRPWYYADTERTQRITAFQTDAVAAKPGLTLVTFIAANNHQLAQVIDRDGTVVHEWNLDWFRLWPDASHLTEEARPKELPGAVVHGVLPTEDGGLILQHDACGMVRLDACGRVVWRLPQRTHHSLHRDERGHIWTSIRHSRPHRHPRLPAYVPPYDEYTIVEISPDGRLLQEFSLFDLLEDNDLKALLFLATAQDGSPASGGDTLHVNDVELFPAHLEPGFFRPGDVMVSLRRPNAVIVFELATRKVKHLSLGAFVRQHDPDFIDGNTISIFDNHNTGTRADGAQSRIIIETVPERQHRIVFAGTPEHPFFTDVMGKHEWLPGGGLLLVESTAGRVLEVDEEGRPVWEFVNIVEPGVVGLVAEGQRLPPQFTAEFYAGRRSACERESGHLAQLERRPE